MTTQRRSEDEIRADLDSLAAARYASGEVTIASVSPLTERMSRLVDDVPALLADLAAARAELEAIKRDRARVVVEVHRGHVDLAAQRQRADRAEALFRRTEAFLRDEASNDSPMAQRLLLDFAALAEPSQRDEPAEIEGDQPQVLTSESEIETPTRMDEPESRRWELDAKYPDLTETSARRVAKWIKANGGEVRYVPPGGFPAPGRRPIVLDPYIAVRSADGWHYAKPGDEIVKGEEWFAVQTSTSPGWGGARKVREFTVREPQRDGEAARTVEYAVEVAPLKGIDALPQYRHMGENLARAQRFVADDISGRERIVQRVVGPWTPVVARAGEAAGKTHCEHGKSEAHPVGVEVGPDLIGSGLCPGPRRAADEEPGL